MLAANYCPGIMLLDFSVQMVTCVTCQKFQHLIFNAVKFKKKVIGGMTFTLASTQRNPKLVAVRLIGKNQIFRTKSKNGKNGEMLHLLYLSKSLQTCMKISVYTFRLSRLIEVVRGPTYMARFKIVGSFYHFVVVSYKNTKP